MKNLKYTHFFIQLYNKGTSMFIIFQNIGHRKLLKNHPNRFKKTGPELFFVIMTRIFIQLKTVLKKLQYKSASNNPLKNWSVCW